MGENNSKAHQDYLIAQHLELQTRRMKIRAYFTGLFGFLGYLKGFGAAIGGFLGWMTGGLVGKASQLGIEEKSKDEEKKQE